MDLLHPSFFFLFMIPFVVSQGSPPGPGYSLSSKVKTSGFSQLFRNLWGPQHQTVSQDQNQLTIWLDKSSGSGFKSIQSYRSGYFATSMKLQAGYTAGVIASFYLSNNEARPGNHDEIDIEFLGTIPGKPYVLQTNVYMKGSGDGNLIGREVRFHLWFDPTKDYHHYAIYWSPNEIIFSLDCIELTVQFFVDDVPIHRYPKKNEAFYPSDPMWVYGSIWDASSWATENGKYKVDYRYQPFVARYTKFAIAGCATDTPSTCLPISSSPTGTELSAQQRSSMEWVQRNQVVYDYCKDPNKDKSKIPEC